MGLTGWLRRQAAARPHVLLAAAPGGTPLRLAVERLLREWDWPEAESAADANLLVSCGEPGPALAGALDRLWGQLGAPRVRVRLSVEDDPVPALHAAQQQLASYDGERGDGEHSDGEAGADPHGSRGHQRSEQLDQLGMADRADDRDGLRLDQLHVPLGPVLPGWPTGLVLRLSLQGDVVQEAEAQVLDPSASSSWWDADDHRLALGRRRAAERLDALARLLLVAGWPLATVSARRLRDDLLAPALAHPTATTGSARVVPHGQVPRTDRDDALLARFDALDAQVRRSRLLRFGLTGVGVLSSAATARAGLPMSYAGDARDRALCWLDDARAGLAGPPGPPRAGTRQILDVLPGLLAGAELATARLIVASLDPDPHALVAVPA